MAPPRHLGNDVVDRADPRVQGKAGDERFLSRVFTPEERDALLADPDSELALWMRWAGKEAAFKSASKALGAPPVFNHALFQVSPLTPADPWPQSEEGDLSFAGTVRYQELSFPLRIAVSPEVIHAVTWTGTAAQDSPSGGSDPPPLRAELASLPRAGPRWREELAPRLTEMEWACVPHEGSALTRIAAKDALAQALAVLPLDVEIGCGPGLPGRRIPRVFLRGEEADVELTLSHHGRFQAWGFRVP